MSEVKVLIGELDGQELLEQCEYELKFNDLPEVDLQTDAPNSGDVLAFNGTKWVPSASAGGNVIAYSKQMGKQGNSGVGKWLDYHHNISSKDVPFSAFETIEIKAIAADIKLSSTVTFTVFKNGSAIETLTITSSMKNKKIGLSISLAVGDFISVKVTSGTAFSPLFHLFFG